MTTTTKISIKLPDGSSKELDKGSNGEDLAKSISPGLAKKAIALDVNGQVKDLFYELQDADEIKIITAGERKSYEILRHTTSHILAAVVQKKYPNAKYAY